MMMAAGLVLVLIMMMKTLDAAGTVVLGGIISLESRNSTAPGKQLVGLLTAAAAARKKKKCAEAR